MRLQARVLNPAETDHVIPLLAKGREIPVECKVSGSTSCWEDAVDAAPPAIPPAPGNGKGTGSGTESVSGTGTSLNGNHPNPSGQASRAGMRLCSEPAGIERIPPHKIALLLGVFGGRQACCIPDTGISIKRQKLVMLGQDIGAVGSDPAHVVPAAKRFIPHHRKQE